MLALIVTFTFMPCDSFAGEGELRLSKTELNLEMLDYDIDNSHYEFGYDSFYILDDADVESVEVADPSIAEATFSYDEVEVEGKAVGTTTITVTGTNGLTGSVTVNVLAPEIHVYRYDSNYDKVRVDSLYIDSYDPDEESTRLFFSDFVTKVRSEDKSIVRVIFGEDDIENGFVYACNIEPQKAGSTNIIVTDSFGNEKTIPVEFTEKGVDECKYMTYLEYRCDDSYIFEKTKTITIYMEEDKDYGVSEAELKNATISVKGDGVNVSGVKGARSYEDGIYERAYVFKVALGRAAKWKESFKVTFSIGKASVTRKYIVRRKLAESAIKETVSNVTYNGKSKEPSFSIKYNGTTFKKDVDYDYWYEDNKNVGTGRIVYYSLSSCPFEFYGEIPFKINPKGTSLSDLKRRKKAFTVIWKKQPGKMSKSRITGYQIQYSTSKTFKTSRKVKVKGYSNTSKKISNLKAKKKYYVRIRTYKVIGKKTYYSKWSKKKYVTTKA